MLPAAATYDELRNRFRWKIPERYNIGVDVCDKWATVEPEREAIRGIAADGAVTVTSFGALRSLSNRLANRFVAAGIRRGDRIAVLLPQSVETAAAHIASFKLGAISVPLFNLFEAEALLYRLADSGAKLIVTDAGGAAKIARIRNRLPQLSTVLAKGGAGPGTVDLDAEIGAMSADFDPVDTRADDPALIIYTSGTTGPPKGALHAHRVLLGHLPGVEMSHDLFPQPGDRIWTPADWAWIGGLLDVLLPALHHGVPVIAARFRKFTGEAAFRLIADQGVRNVFLPPTALKAMRQVAAPRSRWRYDLRTVASGGETLGTELIGWGRDILGVTINEFYGQTECNMIVSSCAAIMPTRPGIMGRAVPGHDLAIVDAEGQPVPDGEQGTIAIRRGSPVMFLEYWNNPEATRKKFAGDWLLTGDTGIAEAGWIRFVGRDDDVITSSGYRIGPGEIEDCLLRHPAVANAGVVGKPDPARTEIVKAFVVLQAGFEPGEELAAELADHVRQHLAAHEYPRDVVFVDSLPMTTTGKVIRRELRARV